MKLNADVIAMDYDRTVAEERLGFMIMDSVKEKLMKLRTHKLMLVTGRRMADIPDRDVAKLFDVIVSENGTIMNFDGGASERILVESGWSVKRDKIENALISRAIECFKGKVIISCYRRDLERIRNVMMEESLLNEVNFELNREGLMILPAGWNKGIGAKLALKIIGGRRLLAIGDDYNDLTLLEAADIKVAVSNAVPELKMVADIICDGEAGEGVMEIIDSLEVMP